MCKELYIIGDSVAAGVVQNEQGRYRLSGQGLPARLASYFNVHRLAKMGAKAADTVELVERTFTERLSGDAGVALVSLGGNDCDFDWLQVAANPKAEHIPGTPMAQFIELIKRLFGRLSEAGLQPMALLPPPIDSRRFFAGIVKQGADAGGVRRFLGRLMRISEWQEHYSLAFASAVNETGHRIIDVRGAFLRQPNFSKLLGRDGMHPNDRGYKLMSDTVLAVLGAV